MVSGENILTYIGMLCMGKSYYEAVHEMDDEYLGHTVNFKTRKHFKDKKSKYVSKDNEAVLHSIQNEMEESEKTEMEKKRTRLTDSKKKASGTGTLNVPNIRRYDTGEDTE